MPSMPPLVRSTRWTSSGWATRCWRRPTPIASTTRPCATPSRRCTRTSCRDIAMNPTRSVASRPGSAMTGRPRASSTRRRMVLSSSACVGISERPDMATLRALGLMSGTSVDGVDVALIETDGEQVKSFGDFMTVPYADDVRRRIRTAFGAEQPNDATAAAEQAVTEAHVDAVKRWSRQSGTALSTLDVVGFHGQTITHRPERHFTWQVGDGAMLARATGVKVVSDLRIADVRAGGQGAPLVPVYHAALARDLPRPLAVVNVGGVGNVTWIGADGSLLAFDTGPGNGPIDDW